MKFLVYKRLDGDVVYIHPDNFIRLVKESKEKVYIKYRLAVDNYCTEEVDTEYGVKLVWKKLDIEIEEF